MAKRGQKHKTIHLVAAIIFGTVTIVHLLRLGYRVPVSFGNWEVPFWLSWIAVFLLGYLTVVMWQSAKT